MISSELVTFGLDWLSKNSLGVVLLIFALIPLFALGVVGYAIHVLAKTIRGKK